jgi:hypothetical protein
MGRRSVLPVVVPVGMAQTLRGLPRLLVVTPPPFPCPIIPRGVVLL